MTGGASINTLSISLYLLKMVLQLGRKGEAAISISMFFYFEENFFFLIQEKSFKFVVQNIGLGLRCQSHITLYVHNTTINW